MSGKQNFIFFFGLFMIGLNFYFSGAFHTLSSAAFGGSWFSSTNTTSTVSLTAKTTATPTNFNPFPLGFTY